jgi:type VI secretion system protein ImpM
VRSEPRFAVSGDVEVGFYGKLPTHGDFLRRRVSDAFVGVWDLWLQQSLSASRLALGDRWLDVYLTSPVWRFACDAGACGPRPVVGIMAPSVDRVGRYFPLTVVAELPADTPSLVTAVLQADSFFDAAERLVIDTLEDEQAGLEPFDERLIALRAALEASSMPPGLVLGADGAAMLDDGAEGWQMPIASVDEIGTAFGQLLSRRLSVLYEPLVLWWTQGSAIVQPSCLVVRGLPHPDSFAAFLDGGWQGRRWRAISAHVRTLGVVAEDPLVDDPAPPRFRSAAASDVGRVREVNQDSFLERPDVGIWAVADGLGGHSHGEVASRMVCDALADIVPDASFEDLLQSACQRVLDVNDQLVRAASRPVNAIHSGSTVVSLLARGTRCAILWAGDSRVYRLRSGKLEQLTRDHSLAASGEADSHAITRAVGGEPTLDLDVYRDRVHPGDRFLLCSDGLTRTVPDAQLQAWLGGDDIERVVQRLIAAALEAGGPDNVTALVVEAFV